MDTNWDDLTDGLAALGNSRRFQIMESLSHCSRCGEELAAQLGISASTVTHHLAVLEKAQLIHRRHQRHYQIVQLNPDRLLELAHVLSNMATRPSTSDNLRSWEERKVLDMYFSNEKLVTLPKRRQHLMIVLNHFLPHFREGVLYTEEEVNRILAPYYREVYVLRDLIVRYRLLYVRNRVYSRR